jgi:hypothetical protein
MKTIPALIAFLITTHFSYGQIVVDTKLLETQSFQNKLSTSYKTMVIHTTNISFVTLRQFKKELNGWNGKVISSQIDTIQKTFTITHNLLLKSAEMNEFLNKYNVKQSAILSYH